jgi:DNA modification methylase
MCGDSTNFQHIKALLNGKKAALVVTDPPYGVSYEGNPSGQDWSMIANDDLRGKTLMDFLFKAFENISSFGIDKMPAYVFYASSTHREFQEALEKAGFTIRQQIIWAKHMVIGNSDYHWTHEPVFYAHIGKDRPPFYGDRTNKTVIETAKMSDIDKLSKEALLGLIKAMKEQSTIQHVQKDTQHYSHPTQKPVAIMTPFIKNSSNVEEIIVDMFTGSGSTMIAAHQLDRVFYGMEFDPRYVDVIRKRYSNYIKADQWEKATPETT